jgi:carbon-monoxide dehydrogenase small subunit
VSATAGGGAPGAAREEGLLEPATTVEVTVRVNGTEHSRTVEARLLLSDFLRHELGLTGTHVGCEHGVCGACTVLLEGQPVRSCLMLAAQVDGRELTTVEGLSPGPHELHPLQEAFWDSHGLQCGFCTPGILMTLVAFLDEHRDPNEDEVRHALSGNLCRCTGYQHIVDAALLYARRRASGPSSASGASPASPSTEPRTSAE